MDHLNYRQVHLDFHTSEKIDNIGRDFDKNQFQEALRIGHVNSITLFSKCHHGWAYHPSKANTIHPHLKYDLLKAQIEAAHEIGVKTPVYISAGLDEKIAHKQPDWLFRNIDESTAWVSDFNQPGYHVFCFNSPYLEMVLNQIEEVVNNYDVDGIFLDIVKPKPCYCHNCRKQLLKEGKDPYDLISATELGERVYKNYTEQVRKVIDRHIPGLPVFHNGGHLSKGRQDLAHMNTHLEIESLPTGGWGYDHFPLSAKYFINSDQDFLGMTGKFHTTWGEFGGFKHPNALLYETSLTLAMGGKCSIGDQLHPFGQMDKASYTLIGKAYKEIEKKEAWCNKVNNVADVAILSAEALDTNNVVDQNKTYPMDVGANRMLLQTHYLYSIIDEFADFHAYKVLILPDTIKPSESLVSKLKDYRGKGGKLLVTGTSLLNDDSGKFEMDLGLNWLKHNDNSPNYFRPLEGCGFDVSTSLVMYSPSEIIELTRGKMLGVMEDSFFNRSTLNFCSHQHTPSQFKTGGPGLVASESAIYIPWNIFSEFAEVASIHLRDMVTYALDQLLGTNKSLSVNLPAQGIVTYMEQAEHKRHILHLLYGSPVLRGYSKVTGQGIEVIEDLVPIYNTRVSLKINQAISKVYLAPEMTSLDFTVSEDTINFTLDAFTCHQMVVIE